MRSPFRVASIAYICYTKPGQLSSPKTESSNCPARRPLMLWYDWWNLVCELRSACARSRTFLWLSLCLARFSTRTDLLGVTSIVRALGLEPACYDRLLGLFPSTSLLLAMLTRALSSVFALPLACRIHEGTVFSNRDHRTLLDKMILLLDSLDLKEPFYLSLIHI